MTKLLIVVPLVLLLCFTFGCQQNEIDSEKAAHVIYDAFMLEEADSLEIIEFVLESEETAVAKFRLNGNRLTSRISRSESGWILSEIQNREDDWVSAEYYLPIKGTVIDEFDDAVPNQNVTLYELFTDEGAIKVGIRVGKGGVFLNPDANTNSQGSFTIIADRRFWKESGKFTLKVTYKGGSGYLRDLNNIIVSVSVDKNAKKVALGKIKVSR